MNRQELLDEQLARAWDAGVLAAFDVVADTVDQQGLLDEIKRRFVTELEMKDYAALVEQLEQCNAYYEETLR